VIRRFLVAAAAIALPLASFGVIARRGADRLLAAPRYAPDEDALATALDALGGEVIRIRSRDGLRLAARWLPAEPATDTPAGDAWRPDPHEAILLLHGYTGSVAPDLVEYGPPLRTTAGVLGLDFRGHGGSEDGPTTFGHLEVEDVAGALAWLGERGITRVALVGMSMGGMTAITAVAVLGDGSLAGADADPDAPRVGKPAPRPQIVAVVADSVAPEVPLVVANRMRGPWRGFVAGRLFAAARRRIGADLRATEPIRVIGLVEPVPLLLIHGDADSTVPIAAGRRLAAAAGPAAQHWVAPGADHSRSHHLLPAEWERRTADFLRSAFADRRAITAILAPPSLADADGAQPDPT